METSFIEHDFPTEGDLITAIARAARLPGGSTLDITFKQDEPFFAFINIEFEGHTKRGVEFTMTITHPVLGRIDAQRTGKHISKMIYNFLDDYEKQQQANGE